MIDSEELLSLSSWAVAMITLYTLVAYRLNHRINPHDKMEKSTEKV